MAGATDFLATINSMVRTVIALTLLGGIAAGGWWGYNQYRKQDIETQRREAKLVELDEQLAQQRVLFQEARVRIAQKDRAIEDLNGEVTILNLDVAEKQEEIDRLATAIQLLKVDHRLAEIKVLAQGEDEETGRLYTEVEFREMNDEGDVIGEPRVYRLNGDRVYVDSWIVKFDDKYIEQSDLLRSTSLCLFRSIFGNIDGPEGSHSLEEVGARPQAYARGGKISDFEKRIWSDFWHIANEPDTAAEMGIRAAHGQANYLQVRQGKTYRLQLRASDGLTWLPGEDSSDRDGRDPT